MGQKFNSNNIEIQSTLNVEFFAQYIFSHISRRNLDARKFDVNDNYNHNRKIEFTGMCVKIKKTRMYASWGLMRENVAAGKYLHLQYAPSGLNSGKLDKK